MASEKDSILSCLRNDPSLSRFVTEGSATGRQLGTGSYGLVEEVEVNGQICAGKIIHKALLDADNIGTETLAQKYIQECKLISSLDHPNITKFFGLGLLPGCQLPVLLMERLEGSLDCHLECVLNIPPIVKCSMLEDVARGLIYLHNHKPKIIHRDLTAKNVLLTSSRLAKITDFGNSRIVNLEPGQLAQSLTYVPGTLAYMPPEALDVSSRYGSALDIFSFGHLALFVELQVFPGKLFHHTYLDPKQPGRPIARSETDRRGEYFEKLEKSKEKHPFVKLIKMCLNNDPLGRPTAEQVLATLEELNVSMKGRSSVPGLCGLVSLGKTSYMNSTLQCLSMTVPLRNYFIGIVPPYLRDINKVNEQGTGGVLARSFSELLWSMWDGTNTSVKPVQFKSTLGAFAPRFSRYTQEDAQEFLTFLLDGLHEDLNKATGMTEELRSMLEETENASDDKKLANEAWVAHLESDRSKIIDLFQGQLRSHLTCGNEDCKKIERTFDSFRYLSLPIPDVDKTDNSGCNYACSLEDCLSVMTQEKGSVTKNWYCPECKNDVELMSKTDIWRTPEILVVCLKRFRPKRNGIEKLDTSVKFSVINLDISPFVSNPDSGCYYDLYATINHVGSTVQGSYNAFVQHEEKWYLCSDEQITQVSDPGEISNAVQGSTVYVLFYKKRK